MLAPNVRVIEPTKKIVNGIDILKNSLPKRVCASCRVSTDSEEQQTSFKSQKEFYTEYITKHEGWIFAGIYADEGLSGTSMRKRKEFNRMIADAMDGKIDIIIVKSVSRFARNVVDILNIVEQLTLKGIPIGLVRDMTVANTAEISAKTQEMLGEIERLKHVKETTIAEGLALERDLSRMDNLREMLNSDELFDKFNADIFRRVVDKVLIDGKTATFVLCDAVRITRPIIGVENE